jgi:UDP-N-acetylglucosamine 2-epimerase (non-hydrolysing)
MYDAFLDRTQKAKKNKILEKLNLEPNSYAILTLHRAENVNDIQKLKSIMKAIIVLKEITFIFPVHPRTREQLRLTDLHKRLQGNSHIRLIDPVGYLEMLKLLAHANLIFTDSGGMQKEAFWIKVPCITPRENTEWVETLQRKANILVGASTKKIVSTARSLLEDKEVKSKLYRMSNPYGNGKASVKVIQTLLQH